MEIDEKALGQPDAESEVAEGDAPVAEQSDQPQSESAQAEGDPQSAGTSQQAEDEAAEQPVVAESGAPQAEAEAESSDEPSSQESASEEAHSMEALPAQDLSVQAEGDSQPADMPQQAEDEAAEQLVVVESDAPQAEADVESSGEPSSAQDLSVQAEGDSQPADMLQQAEDEAAEQPVVAGPDAPQAETEAESSGEPSLQEGTSEEAHPMEALLAEDLSMQAVKRGEVLEGTIVRIADQEMLIDVGGKMEALVPVWDLEKLGKETRESLEVGDSVTAYVLTPEDSNGNILLSLSRAQEEKDWIEAERYLSEKLVYEGIIHGFNKGGLIVHFGRLRGFLPGSQVSMDRRRRSTGSTPEERWSEMLGEPVAIKVIEVDRSRNRLILSERAATRESRAARKETLLQELEVGQVKEGRVISLTDFGAFVDLGGADGLIHLSELSWSHVTHPREAVSVGDKVKVEVISIDRERQRIGLSLKSQLEDPWDVAIKQYQVGQLVQGTVTKLAKFGAFARLVDSPEMEGLIHISELADHRVAHPGDVVAENDVLTLRIVRIEPERRRIGLSLKQVDSEAFIDTDWQTLVDEVNLDEVIGDEVEPEAEVAVEDEPQQEADTQDEGDVEADGDEGDDSPEAE